MRAMTGLAERLPHVAAFPEALGTGLLLHTDVALNQSPSPLKILPIRPTP